MSNYENDSNESDKQKGPIKTGKPRSFWKSVGKIALAVALFIPILLIGGGGDGGNKG